MKVLLLTDNQLDKLEFILNKFLGRYLFVTSESLDIDGNILTVTTDKKETTKEDVTNKHVINADKLKRLYATLTTKQKNRIKSRFSNVNLRTWILNNEVDFTSIKIKSPKI